MEIIDLSKSTTGKDGFRTFLDDLCQEFELDYASYCAIDTMSAAVEGYANYPDAWIQHYMENGLQNVDPTLAMSSLSIAPVDWARFRGHVGFEDVFKNSRDFGISNRGVTVPIRGPLGECGLLSVTRDCDEREWQLLGRKIVTDLQGAAVHLHDAVMQSDALAFALRRPTLSKREIEILQWTAAGKTQQDVGDILGISNRTVEVHLRSTRVKMSALTTPQAVGRGISMGLIYPK